MSGIEIVLYLLFSGCLGGLLAYMRERHRLPFRVVTSETGVRE